ncbi:putative ribonuclease H domain-containing protein [Arabidopsis thaliana]
MTPEEAECSTLIWAIQAARAYGYTKVIFEGDNININRLINQKSPNPRLQHYLDIIYSWIPTLHH